jgi:hypothetical protein
MTWVQEKDKAGPMSVNVDKIGYNDRRRDKGARYSSGDPVRFITLDVLLLMMELAVW